MKQLTRQKNKDVLDKYFPEMQIWEHDFNVNTGVCSKCNKFFAERGEDNEYHPIKRMCPVIGREEVEHISDPERNYNLEFYNK